MPFDRLPFNNIQPGQEEYPLGWAINRRNITQPVQGFGPTAFAYGNLNLYSATFQIHSGVDYGTGRGDGNTWDDRVILSLCDGVIISGNWFSSGFNTGGSAQPGRGVSVRCFANDLDTIWADTDVDGNPNLSNVVVTYNHLVWQPNYSSTPDDDRFFISAAPHYIDCSLLTGVTCTGYYELPRVEDVVRTGETLGQTGADPTFDHLHLSVFFARGFSRNDANDNAFYLNPMLMYTAEIEDTHVIQSYFPYDISSPGNLVEDDLEIGSNELKRWAAGGWNSIPYGNISTNTFWEVQTPNPPAPNNVEWPNDNYPLVAANDPAYITDSIEYLDQSFANAPYQYPNCTLSTDTSRTPYRTVAQCDLTDLDDETAYNVVPHPTATPAP
jgi:hypothetical protein